jgi:hypothetical protein
LTQVDIGVGEVEVRSAGWVLNNCSRGDTGTQARVLRQRNVLSKPVLLQFFDDIYPQLDQGKLLSPSSP